MAAQRQVWRGTGRWARLGSNQPVGALQMLYRTECGSRALRLPGGEQPSGEDLVLLVEYAHPVEGIAIDETLGREYREAVEELTGNEDVGSPGRAARALLATIGSARLLLEAPEG